MKILKNAAIILLTAVCICVLIYLGFFILRMNTPISSEPVALQSAQELFPPKEVTKTVEEEVPAEEEIPDDLVPMTAEEKAKAYLQTLTPEERIWQLFYVTPESLTNVETATRAGETTQKALSSMPVGGICYFAENLEDPQQVSEMLSATKQYARTPLFLGVDEEGGSVSHLGSNEAMGVLHLEPAATYGQADDVQGLYDQSSALAGQMLSLGFNMNFAPVADLQVEGNEVIGDRAYSADPAVVGRLSGAMVTGLQEHGIAACLKHFPGHGSATTDTHNGKSVSQRTLEQLRNEEFSAFREGIDSGVYFVMMAHLTNENFSSHPASLSPEVVSLLRNELNFEGVIITDALRMGAITDTYGADEAAVMAITAGCDMILIPNSVEKAFMGILKAVQEGTLTQERIDESVMRILTTKFNMGIMQ